MYLEVSMGYCSSVSCMSFRPGYRFAGVVICCFVKYMDGWCNNAC